MSEQLRDRTWDWPVPGVGASATDLRLNADGTLRFGGVQDGTWNVTGERLNLSFAPMMQNLDLKTRIQSAFNGNTKVAFRILELTGDSVTIHRLTPDGKDDPDEKDETLTLASP